MLINMMLQELCDPQQQPLTPQKTGPADEASKPHAFVGTGGDSSACCLFGQLDSCKTGRCIFLEGKMLHPNE